MAVTVAEWEPEERHGKVPCPSPCPVLREPVAQLAGGVWVGRSPAQCTLNSWHPPHSDIPHEMGMRLAFIGDELELRWMLPRIAQMPWMAMYR